ncbi:hypothetical protein GUJ93_ZPchr0001g32753 [Zizania palustris]|uniref:Uncharacterized protein n=1 Tax=Zizania palustris TaxID=103762 RepID=A0A8J5RRY5_ZIZPA|nr:hypothetical protein GUJ93_ZPchr0001g32753 [Zizania palustris]
MVLMKASSLACTTLISRTKVASFSISGRLERTGAWKGRAHAHAHGRIRRRDGEGGCRPAAAPGIYRGGGCGIRTPCDRRWPKIAQRRKEYRIGSGSLCGRAQGRSPLARAGGLRHWPGS